MTESTKRNKPKSSKSSGKVARVAAKRPPTEAERRVAAERKALFASRPDICPELIKIYSNKPLAECRAMLATIKIAEPPRPAYADELDRMLADGRPVATVYKQGGRTFHGFNPRPSTAASRPIVPPEPEPIGTVSARDRQELDSSFGSGRPAITRVGNKKSYGAMSVEEARAALRKLAAASKGAV